MDSHLLPEEKLAVLQAADPRRKWHSLDDQRVCVLCDRAITGRQIEITRAGSGRYSMRCPTEGCVSTPDEWFYHGSASAGPKVSPRRTREMSFWEQ